MERLGRRASKKGWRRVWWATRKRDEIERGGRSRARWERNERKNDEYSMDLECVRGGGQITAERQGELRY